MNWNEWVPIFFILHLLDGTYDRAGAGKVYFFGQFYHISAKIATRYRWVEIWIFFTICRQIGNKHWLWTFQRNYFFKLINFRCFSCCCCFQTGHGHCPFLFYGIIKHRLFNFPGTFTGGSRNFQMGRPGGSLEFFKNNAKFHRKRGGGCLLGHDVFNNLFCKDK